MKRLYLECAMGAAGDMLTAALLELYPEPQHFIDTMNSLGLPGVRVARKSAATCGITGTQMEITVNGKEEQVEDVPLAGGAVCLSSGENGHVHSHPAEATLPGHTHAQEHHHEHEAHCHEHHHSHGQEAHSHDGHDNGGHHHHHEEGAHSHHHAGYADICRWIDGLDLPEAVRSNARDVYRLIGEAEAHAHGAPLEQIHFHEVGTLDAVADVVGFCLLMDWLKPDVVTASPVHVGSGYVRCAHGVLPVPAPATAYLLQGIPSYGGSVKGELCTPTGAALLRKFATSFGPMPQMVVQKVGYGLGKKVFAAANCVRAFWGEDASPADRLSDRVVELKCNLDDMTPEAIGYATERLLEGGALDVFTIPIGMKKNRPGVLLTCLCHEEKKEELVQLMLLHTTTLGVRECVCQRYILAPKQEAVHTPYGEVRIKVGEGRGIYKQKPEYEDVKRAAQQFNVPFAKVQNCALEAAGKRQEHPNPAGQEERNQSTGRLMCDKK